MIEPYIHVHDCHLTSWGNIISQCYERIWRLNQWLTLKKMQKKVWSRLKCLKNFSLRNWKTMKGNKILNEIFVNSSWLYYQHPTSINNMSNLQYEWGHYWHLTGTHIYANSPNSKVNFHQFKPNFKIEKKMFILKIGHSRLKVGVQIFPSHLISSWMTVGDKSGHGWTGLRKSSTTRIFLIWRGS